MTATSIAPYLDFGVFVVAELELAVAVELPLLVAVEPADVAAVLVAVPVPLEVDRAVAVLDFPLLVLVADDVELVAAEDPDDCWAKTAPDVEELALEVTEDEPEAEDATASPLQEPEILMLW
jgi:hypothetical protein